LTLLAAGLDRSEFEVHVCALTRGGPLAADLERANIPLTIIGKRGKLDPFAFRRLWTHIADLKPDLVQTWLFAANSYGRVAASWAGVPHIFASERCVDPWKRWHEFAIDRRLARRTERIVVNSSGVREFYVKHGLPADKFALVPNGIIPRPAAEIVPDPADRARLCAELGLPVDAYLIAAVGRLWPQKRIKDLIWATDLLKVIRQDIHLLVIGEGPQQRQLERYRRLIEIEDHVHFLGARSDVLRILPHCLCLWLGSEYEGLPNVVMEAMESAVPVVASDIAGNRDLVVPDETGYLFPVGDRATLVRCTQRLADDAALRQRLGAAGRERIVREFGVQQMVDRFAALYRAALA
jgi:glycosyltransferase involved in cell wall biosynthesis